MFALITSDAFRGPRFRVRVATDTVGAVLVLGVCSLKGGVGKTSVTLGLASAALERGLRTLVVDLDPQGDSTLALAVAPGAHLDVSAVLDDPRAETAVSYTHLTLPTNREV